MDNQTLQRIKDVLGRSQRVAVAVGKNPTVDDMGAALALYLTFQGMSKTCAVISATEPLVEVSNLVGIDKVKTRYEADGADLVVSFPYKEGEIEKVSYTIDNGYLNIVVKAGDQGLNFQERDVKYTRGGGGSGGQLDLLIAVGVGRLSDLQGMFDMDTLKDVTIVNIDNKQDNQGFGDIVLVSPRFSSISEQVAQLLADLNTEPDVDVAQNLLDGISFATDNFQSPQTSFLAFEMAGILMRHGALRARLQAAPRRDFMASQMLDRPAAMPQPRQPFAQMPGGQQQPQQQSQRRQPQHGQDRRQQFQERRGQHQPQQQSQQRFNQPAQQAPMQSQAPQPAAQGQMPSAMPTMPNPAPQPRFNQPAQQAPMQVQAPQTQAQPQSQQQQQPQQQGEDLNPPSDWLTPKVYKGSTNI